MVLFICKFISGIIYIFHPAFRRRQWHPTPVLLPGKSHGRRSLVGCSPWGRKESDTTERLHFHFSLSCVGEGNDNPLQCSCLENPRDGGAWWAAFYWSHRVGHDWSDVAAASCLYTYMLRNCVKLCKKKKTTKVFYQFCCWYFCV